MAELHEVPIPEEETEEAKAARIAQAIAERGYSDGLVWMVIERALGLKRIDEITLACEYIPDDTTWVPLIPADIPGWVSQPAVISQLMNGEMANADPGQGGLWYRGIVMNNKSGAIH